MKIPAFKRLWSNDYPQQYSDLIDILSLSINNAVESINTVLTNNITFADNMNSIVKDVQVEVDSNGKPKTKTTFALTGTGGIQGLMVVRATNITNTGVYPSGGVFISFTETTTNVTIDNVAGLPANNTFILRVIALR